MQMYCYVEEYVTSLCSPVNSWAAQRRRIRQRQIKMLDALRQTVETNQQACESWCGARRKTDRSHCVERWCVSVQVADALCCVLFDVKQMTDTPSILFRPPSRFITSFPCRCSHLNEVTDIPLQWCHIFMNTEVMLSFFICFISPVKEKKKFCRIADASSSNCRTHLADYD